MSAAAEITDGFSVSDDGASTVDAESRGALGGRKAGGKAGANPGEMEDGLLAAVAAAWLFAGVSVGVGVRWEDRMVSECCDVLSGTNLDIPKSVTLTTQWLSTTKLEDFKSLCTIGGDCNIVQ